MQLQNEVEQNYGIMLENARNSDIEWKGEEVENRTTLVLFPCRRDCSPCRAKERQVEANCWRRRSSPAHGCFPFLIVIANHSLLSSSESQVGWGLTGTTGLVVG
jgi:hypothetical protein